MKKLLGSIVAALLFAGPALADWTGKDASGTTITFKNANVCSSVVCVPIAQPVDATGAAFGVTANPIFVAPGSGQTFPVSAASLPLPTGAATQTTLASILTALGSPFQAGGSIGNTSFAATQATASALNATVVGTGTFAVQATLQASATTAIGKVDPNTPANWAIGSSTQNSASVANGHLVLGQFNTTPTTITTGNMSPIQMDSAGNTLVNVKAGTVAATQSGTWNIGSITTLPALVAGSAIIGKVGIDQTTPGTTNGVQVNAALPAGSNVIGKTGIDQTTPGTTNLVNSKNCDATTTTQCGNVKAASTAAAFTDLALVADPRPNSAATISGVATNPTATLTLPATTTAYTAGQLIANSATAGSVVNPSFAVANSAGGAVVARLRLSTNDTTSTAWAGQTVQVDLWTATPTWTNGDRGTWLPATGSASHIGAFTCVFPTAVWGDGLAAECAPNVGNFASVKLASGTSVFWSLDAITGSGVTGASKVFTLAAEVLN